ncbi:MAG TPA: type II toxin-antitoxin system HicA family toxin [Anaerolineales bacterium]|nr:type II toxin-antitoxin system HicA family toxin [Anaerolineales bacterium]
MSRLRLVAFSTLAKVAEAKGFYRIRQEGSHNIFRSADGKIIVIPNHGSQVIVRPLLRKILRDMGVSPDEYEAILKKL